MFYFFLTIYFINTNFCVLACLIIWMHNFFFINSYEIFSCVYTFYWLSDEGIKHLYIDILINEN